MSVRGRGPLVSAIRINEHLGTEREHGGRRRTVVLGVANIGPQFTHSGHFDGEMRRRGEARFLRLRPGT